MNKLLAVAALVSLFATSAHAAFSITLAPADTTLHPGEHFMMRGTINGTPPSWYVAWGNFVCYLGDNSQGSNALYYDLDDGIYKSWVSTAEAPCPGDGNILQSSGGSWYWQADCTPHPDLGGGQFVKQMWEVFSGAQAGTTHRIKGLSTFFGGNGTSGMEQATFTNDVVVHVAADDPPSGGGCPPNHFCDEGLTAARRTTWARVKQIYR